MKRLHILAVVVLVAVVLTPAAMADGRNPGSTLIFTNQLSGPGWFTIISVTNTNLAPITPISFGGSTLVHYEYVNTVRNPADPQLPLNCIIFNRREFLTPADTLSVLTTYHNAFSFAGQQGYLVCSAEDPAQFDVAWDHDFLIGSELVVNALGGMYSLNALPFEAIPGAGLATDVNANGQLDFDGVEYEAIPDILYIDSFIALAKSTLTLINLTGSATDRNMITIDAWNDNEFPLSSTKVFSCWFDQPLVNVSPMFDNAFLTASTPHDPSELDLTGNGINDVETGWAMIQSVNVETVGGNFVDSDGAMLGAITAGATSIIDGGHLLWESTEKQTNGSFLAP
jgi:hypothetical protein